MPTSWTTHPQAPPTKTTSNPNPKHTNTPTNEAIEGQQDGVQDEKGEGEAEEKRKQTCHKKVVNFFITNFQVSSCKTSLHDLFVECGEILDVYIARKLSKVGKRFGFARFSHAGDVQGLENQLNGITIGSFKLIANIAKFERYVCLTLKKKQEASDFLLNRKDCWSNWFKWLQPWTSELKTEDRITWLRIEGLPIHVWCSEAFSQIASVWGTVLIPDECETNDPNFVYDDHGNDMVGETKPVDGSLEGTPVASIEIPTKRIIDSEKRGVHDNTTKRVCSERDGTMNTCAGSYASPLGADCSLSESRTSDTTSKIQKKEKIEELKDISPKLRSSKALEFAADMFHIDVPILYAFTNEMVANVDVLAS
nr:nucleotide-binding alpha-beta plait domain-containing protein [Tanacetum cinerariifolium]